MLLEWDAKRTLSHLVQTGSAEVELLGATVTMRLDSDNKIVLSATIFSGDDYIPPSVRQALGSDLPNGAATIRTFPKIDEALFTVYLHYFGVLSAVNLTDFKALLEEFGWLVDEWRRYLDDRGRDDLVHVYNQ